MILDNGRFTTVDVASLSARAERAVARMRDVNVDALRAAAALEDVFGSFCIALGSRPYHVHRFVDDTEHQ